MEGNKAVSGKLKVPTMIFTEDTKPYDSGYEFFDRETRWNDIHRGPILRVVSTSMELLLTFNKKPKPGEEGDFENASEGISEYSDSRKSNDVETEFVHETPEPFAATPKCKQMRLIVLTNEGTTTIRYQWLRFPPSKAMRTMLANPRCYLNLSDENGEPETASPQDNTASGYGNNLSKPRKGLNPSVSDIDYSMSNSRIPSHSISGVSVRDSNDESQKVPSSTNVEYEKAKDIIGRKPGFLRDASFDFHFREMPGMLLPGQKVEFPILYRPRQPGYCHENLYLLTHPRLADENDRTFMVRLTGICMEPDCLDSNKDKEMTGKERSEPDCVKRAVTKTMLELEGADLIDSVLDHALYMKQKRNTSTLPFGKLTPESIFNAHNPQLYYHYGVAERALKTVRKVVQVLIPLHRIEKEDDEICSLSIKDLYSLLWRKPETEEFFNSRFRTTKTEKLLRTLGKCSRILSRPPVFAFANAGTRKHTACYTNMVAVMDGILEKMDSIKENFTETPLYRVQKVQLELSIRRKKLRDHARALRKEKQKYLNENENCEPNENQRHDMMSGFSGLHSEPGEFETTSVYETDGPVKATRAELVNPPTGHGTKEVGFIGLPAENMGTAADEETERKISLPGAEMESKDEETASFPEETLETDDETDVIPPKEIEEDKDKETKDKKAPTHKSKLKINKGDSEDSEKDNQAQKSKKTKKDKSRLDRQESKKPKKKDKKQKGSVITSEDKATLEAGVEDGHDSKVNSPGNINITPESLDDHDKQSSEIPRKAEGVNNEEMMNNDIEAEVEEMLRVRTEKKIRQARLIAFENMLGSGIERMLTIVDTMRYFHDYQTSQFYPGEKYCCQQD